MIAQGSISFGLYCFRSLLGTLTTFDVKFFDFCLKSVIWDTSVWKPTDSSSQEAEHARSKCLVAWSFMLFYYFFPGEKCFVLDINKKKIFQVSIRTSTYLLPQKSMSVAAQERDPDLGKSYKQLA